MQKTYHIENLDCANCAAKAEEKIRKLPGVADAVITFSTMQLRLTADDPDEILSQVLEAARQIEPDIQFLSVEHSHNTHHHDEECSCGNDHHHDHHHDHSRKKEKSELPAILLGAALFAAGLLLDVLNTGLPVSIVAFVASYLILGWDILTSAGKNILRGQIFDENFLMSIATIGAFIIGEYPEAVGVMLFFRIGEFFEHKAVARSRKNIMDAVDMRPEVVQLTSGAVIPAGQAQIGDEIVVVSGDRIPLDGIVISGESRLDTAPITGEPVPVAVKPGEEVTSGCVNLSGRLVIRVEKPLEESVVTRILNSVETAAASKPKLDRFITRFARVYTPVVVFTAVAVAVIPSLVTGEWNYWVYTALSFLVMSCPCALVLSVPLAFFSGIGAGSKTGILFKGGASIEALAKIKAVALDKTGTVTKGDFSVQEVQGGEEILRLCASCEASSKHPIATSILSQAQKMGLSLSLAEELEEIPGHGICGRVDGKQILCGNEKLMAQYGIAAKAEETGGTWVFVAVDGILAGRICISDTLKPDAKAAVTALQEHGIATAMLTGDAHTEAAAVAAQTGIDNVYARLLPDEKLETLQKIREKYGPVMFVGDGINDAPVLSGADVGAAMGSGADAAIEAADVVFMTNRVSAIPQALEIAASTQRVAVENVVFALAVKLVVMVLGLTGHASMWAAVFADSGVAMLCVLNAIRVLYKKK